jgi:hypothetical protein
MVMVCEVQREEHQIALVMTSKLGEIVDQRETPHAVIPPPHKIDNVLSVRLLIYSPCAQHAT